MQSATDNKIENLMADIEPNGEIIDFMADIEGVYFIVLIHTN